MVARVYVLQEGNMLAPSGDALVRSCDGIFITFLTNNKTFSAKEAMTPTGYDSFTEKVNFIAVNFPPQLPEEFVPPGLPFQVLPNMKLITPDRSDLGLGLTGAADTIVFKFNEETPIMLFQFYKTSGVWFSRTSHIN